MKARRLKSLIELTDTNCHWPIGHVGEPGFGFCGAKATRQPYCERHRVRAYTPDEEVRPFGFARNTW